MENKSLCISTNLGHYSGSGKPPLLPPTMSKPIVYVLIALNLVITLTLAAKLNVWYDEAYSLIASGGDISYATHQAFRFERNQPLYFVLLIYGEE